MTYDTRERSAAEGRPSEFYTFALGATIWRFTSGNQEPGVAPLWTPATIRRGRLEQGSEMNRSGLTLDVPADFPIAELWRVYPPTGIVSCVLQRAHVGDWELATIWTGRVVNVAWKEDLSQATISMEPIYTGLRRTGLRRVYGKQCPHVLYGSACGVLREDYRADGTVGSVTSSTVQAPEWGALPTGWADGGYLEYSLPGGILERRLVKAHAGDTITVMGRPAGLEVGAVASLFPGCDHSLETCHDKFSNAANFGGTPFIPNKNPFSGDPIY